MIMITSNDDMMVNHIDPWWIIMQYPLMRCQTPSELVQSRNQAITIYGNLKTFTCKM